MTAQFIRFCELNETVATPKSYEYMDIVESAYDAMKDGVNPLSILNVTTSYTRSLVYELLENAKNLLFQLIQKVLSGLNNLQVNNVRLLRKYYELVQERLPSVKEPIIYEGFEYPSLKDYPTVIKATNIEKDIRRLQEMIQDPNTPPSANKIHGEVDMLLRDFSKQVIGKPVNVTCLRDSTAEIVRKKAKGKNKQTIITSDTLATYMGEVDRYKQDKDELNRLKKMINEDYLQLKEMYASTTEDPQKLAKNTIRYMTAPDKEEIIRSEYSRYADIHVEMLRLFNGFITIYESCFNTLLNVLDEKITARKNVIIKIFMETGLFAALNTK